MTYERYLNELTSYFFRSEAATHNEMFGRTLTWDQARQLWAKARIEACRHAK
jgi:hypothetical protein